MEVEGRSVSTKKVATEDINDSRESSTELQIGRESCVHWARLLPRPGQVEHAYHYFGVFLLNSCRLVHAHASCQHREDVGGMKSRDIMFPSRPSLFKLAHIWRQSDKREKRNREGDKEREVDR